MPLRINVGVQIMTPHAIASKSLRLRTREHPSLEITFHYSFSFEVTWENKAQALKAGNENASKLQQYKYTQGFLKSCTFINLVSATLRDSQNKNQNIQPCVLDSAYMDSINWIDPRKFQKAKFEFATRVR